MKEPPPPGRGRNTGAIKGRGASLDALERGSLRAGGRHKSDRVEATPFSDEEKRGLHLVVLSEVGVVRGEPVVLLKIRVGFRFADGTREILEGGGLAHSEQGSLWKNQRGGAALSFPARRICKVSFRPRPVIPSSGSSFQVARLLFSEKAIAPSISLPPPGEKPRSGYRHKSTKPPFGLEQDTCWLIPRVQHGGWALVDGSARPAL